MRRHHVSHVIWLKQSHSHHKLAALDTVFVDVLVDGTLIGFAVGITKKRPAFRALFGTDHFLGMDQEFLS